MHEHGSTQGESRRGEHHGSSRFDDGHDRWQWRSTLRANPRGARVYRFAVAVLGFVVVMVGIILLPFPGPGWVVIFLGLGIWASEFEWAQRLLLWVKTQVERWWSWLESQGWWAKVVVALLTAMVVLAIFWAMFVVSGVPGWFPHVAREFLTRLPGVTG